jgi:arginyl-tRNA synthetase
MTDITKEIEIAAAEAVKAIYQVDIPAGDFLVTSTKKEHKGDYTLVTFAVSKTLRQPPPQIAAAIGEYIQANRSWVSSTEVLQGFLNISLSTDYWMSVVSEMHTHPDFWKPVQAKEKVLVEFASPNTNKPLHLGHIRNILLGWSTYKILSACGHDVHRVQIVNDRGIAICKSMLAWKRFGEDATPQSSGIKSDHFVGDWYVRFEKEFSAEYKAWQEKTEAQDLFSNRKDKEQAEADFFKAYKNAYFNTSSQLGKEARELLLKWEAHDEDTLALWKIDERLGLCRI